MIDFEIGFWHCVVRNLESGMTMTRDVRQKGQSWHFISFFFISFHSSSDEESSKWEGMVDRLMDGGVL